MNQEKSNAISRLEEIREHFSNHYMDEYDEYLEYAIHAIKQLGCGCGICLMHNNMKCPLMREE